MLMDAKGKSLIEYATQDVPRRAPRLLQIGRRDRPIEAVALYAGPRQGGELLEDARGSLDGVVSKRIDSPYLPGELCSR